MMRLIKWARRSSLHHPFAWSLAWVIFVVASVIAIMVAGTPG